MAFDNPDGVGGRRPMPGGETTEPAVELDNLRAAEGHAATARSVSGQTPFMDAHTVEQEYARFASSRRRTSGERNGSSASEWNDAPLTTSTTTSAGGGRRSVRVQSMLDV